MPEETVVIGGAGHAGVQSAVRLRELGWPGRITMIAPDSDLPYERPPLSKHFLASGSAEEVVPLRRAGYFEDKRIERVCGRIRQVVPDGRYVLLDNGARYDYAKLVLALGSEARNLAVPGGDLPGVHRLKTREDAGALKKALRRGTRVVVVGAGYIGLEVAAAAAALGCETTILEIADRAMNRVTSEPVSRFFEQLHREHGTELYFGTAVTEIRGEGAVQEVVTSDGAIHPADVVVVGIGVVPSQNVARDCGLRVDDGIVVDHDGRTGHPDIYAAGDVTRLKADGVDLRLESIQSAVSQAARAADHIMGLPPGKREVPWFWTIQHGVRLQTAGLRRPDDTVLVRTHESGQFSVLYLRAGRLAAIDAVGTLRDFNAGKKLIGAGARLDPRRAADSFAKLSDAVEESAVSEI
ncbi:putative ferredoxin reductase [Nocardia jinanensis]|uniref:Ferredoxin reductase n=2 Tax=Nocardia jinanensis TaxID=382504 RepID=A0A917RKA0_9NOCA|nr:putative ferredoxin reductase [Nocardia jinanensis]